MQDVVKSSLTKLPEKIVAYAPTMIGRVVDNMQITLGRDAHLPNISYCALLVKLGAADIAREFTAHLDHVLTGAAVPPQDTSFSTTISSLPLELLSADGPDPSVQALRASSDLFDTVAAKAKVLGIKDFRIYGKKLFLAALRQGFTKARIDEENIARLLPYACSALDTELVTLYGRFETMLGKIQSAATSSKGQA